MDSKTINFLSSLYNDNPQEEDKEPSTELINPDGNTILVESIDGSEEVELNVGRLSEYLLDLQNLNEEDLRAKLKRFLSKQGRRITNRIKRSINR